MQPEELLELRRTKWRVAGHAARTLEDAAAFLEEVGLCLLYPHRRALLVSTFVGAYLGREDNLPDGLTARRAPAEHAADAASEATADEAKEMMVRLLRARLAFEAPFGPENSLLIAGSTFPFFYALVGDRNFKDVPASGPRAQYSQLAIDAFEVIRRDGPISKGKLLAILGGGLSEAGIDSALEELWTKLRITRVDYREGEGIFWDVLYRWAPEAVKEGAAMSVTEALSALVSKYLDGVVSADPAELEEFFAQFAARARVKEAVNLLLATREITYLRLGPKSVLAITPPREEPPPRVPHELRIRLPKPPRSAPADGEEKPARRVVGHGERPPAFGKKLGAKRTFAGKPGEGGERRSFRPGAGRPRPEGAERGRPAFDRPASDQPRGERPFSGGKRFEKKPFGKFEKRAPGGKPFGKKPFGAKPFGRPAAPRAEEGGDEAAEPTFESKPFTKRPFEKKPFGKKPFGKFEKRPAGSAGPSGGKPFGKKPFGKFEKRSSGDRPFAKKPFGDKPFRERSSSDRPAGDRPARSFADRAGRPPARSGGARFGKPAGAGEGKPFRKTAGKFGGKPGFKRAGKPDGAPKPPRKHYGKLKKKREEGGSE